MLRIVFDGEFCRRFPVLSKPSTAPAFGVPNTFPAQQAVDPAKAALEAAKEKPKYFTTEHFVPASGYEKKLSAKTRVNGQEVWDLKQRPLVMERHRFEERAFLHYTVLLDRSKHIVPTYCPADGQKAWEVYPRPGPDNLFEMLAILAIELKVPIRFSPD